MLFPTWMVPYMTAEKWGDWIPAMQETRELSRINPRIVINEKHPRYCCKIWIFQSMRKAAKGAMLSIIIRFPSC